MTLRSHPLRFREPRLRARWSLLSIALSLGGAWCAPARASHPTQGPTVYGVRPGSIVLACGGFDGHCETWQLSGTIEIQPNYVGHQPEEDTPPVIVHSALELTMTNGYAAPFPSPSDLPLTALEGSLDGAGFRFESPPPPPVWFGGSVQTAELTFTPFRDGQTVSGGLALNGFYDEGCCDRFRIDFGNVVLLAEGAPNALEFQSGRFRATATWRAASGRQGVGSPVAIDDASGFFWFFTTNNPEVFVKVLDACALNHRYWIFAGGLTNLGVQITMSDQRTGVSFPIVNPLGTKFATFIDTSSFPCDSPVP